MAKFEEHVEKRIREMREREREYKNKKLSGKRGKLHKLKGAK